MQESPESINHLCDIWESPFQLDDFFFFLLINTSNYNIVSRSGKVNGNDRKRRWPWCKSSLRLYACKISIFSFYFLLTVERKSVLPTNELDTDRVHSIYLSLYIFILVKSISFSLLFARQWTRCMISFYVCVCVLCFVDNTSTHTQLNC